jgi:catechol 2,3-dioxygenase-like lactoylglutathione lyase family enzyme
MPSPFRRLHHICLVVHDIDAAVQYYEGIGIGPWQDYPPLSQYTDLQVPDVEAFMQMKYRYVDLANVQIQLCEPPPADCAQRRFLNTRGEGVFHVGFEASLDEAISQAHAVGLDLLMSGRRENRSGFVYFDTLDQTGVVWMCRQTDAVGAASSEDPEGVLGHDYEGYRRVAGEADGSRADDAVCDG